ncbi:MAG: site-specific DNA-methyltransferase [Clostridia bacterium]|nr:site-specific DNA-methyltransferase [Clostridia bacterium]
MRIYCKAEHHDIGGPGSFFLARSEKQLPALIREYGGKVQLIYLDPPFGTGDSFQRKGEKDIPLFRDDMPEGEYLKWMRTILTGCHALLSPTGSLYLHIDWRMSAKLRLLLDEIFGQDNFMDEIVWGYKSGGRATRFFPRKHDTILFYRKSRKVYFNIAAVGQPRGPERRNHMKQFVDQDGRVGFSIRTNGKLYTYYEDDLIYPTDVWTDIEHLQQKDKERLGYATQKPEALLERIVLASSKPGDLVCDLFSGSGTTAAVAVKNGRRFLAVDASPLSLVTLRKRLLSIAASPTLLDEPDQAQRPMTLHFPALRNKCDATFSVEERNVIVTKAQLNRRPSPLSYAAIGYEKEQTFYPTRTVTKAKLPLKLPLPEGVDMPVIQLVNGHGDQAFFTVDR